MMKNYGFNLLVDLSTSNLARLFFNIIIMNGGVLKSCIICKPLYSVPLLLRACVIDVGYVKASSEGTRANGADAVCNVDLCQIIATLERRIANFRYALGNCYFRYINLIEKYGVTDNLNTVRNNYVGV